ncbi:hypothetical protein N7509_006001 [Penicillium cosmopolitanum]|uniref:BZIP domain-containing protein n=1 Tax=Penicillium cosmopolitanum TaxID=1131564 RepID=A0A9W9W3L8_9EURO|nr:uncharacterized protein N7509_006001 [Penicillium cosmopolitanum]KAJ5397888.1 hypothetical protein N7509_006001 [Penicillium cosmopolitanum]
MAASIHENTHSAEGSSKSPKKRVITPARKAQNRAAQQAYRKRQSERKAQSISQRGVTKKLAPRPSAASQEESSPVSEPESATFRRPSLEISDLRISQRTTSIPLADPMANTLRTTRDTIWGAVLNNAVCLGFDLTRLADCRRPYISPFFKSITSQDEPQAVVASTFDATIPVHLQPTMAQILVPHHASLDLIPLPLLRDRVIMMSFAMPQIFDLWDLKLDIYVHHALVYRSGGSHREYQSWDQNSWKATPWFLRKWCLDWVKELAVSEDS